MYEGRIMNRKPISGAKLQDWSTSRPSLVLINSAINPSPKPADLPRPLLNGWPEGERNLPRSWGCWGRSTSPPIGDRTVSRLSRVRCRWGGKSPSPASDQPAIRLTGALRLDAESAPAARGMQRESATSPLPRLRIRYGSTPHILRPSLSLMSLLVE